MRDIQRSFLNSSTLDPIHSDYFNDNADFYSNVPPAGNFDLYPFQGLTLLAEVADSSRRNNTFENSWSVFDGPSPVVNSPRGILASENYNPVDWDPYIIPTDGYAQPTYSSQYLTEVPAQHEPIGLSNWDGSLTSAGESKAPTTIPAPSSVPFYNRGDDQSGYAIDARGYQQNVHTSPQFSAGATTTAELVHMNQFQQHGVYPAHTTEYANAGAGPLTVGSWPVIGISASPTQPSGWIPETTAGAEQSQPFTEENEAPKPNCNEATRASTEMNNNIDRLLEWAQKREKLSGPPSLNEALAIAVDVIPTIRQVVYHEPSLFMVRAKQGERNSKGAEKERNRRNVRRGLFQELSRYYLCPSGLWTRAKLLSKVVQDLETHPTLQETPDDSAPEASTSTTTVSEFK